jgi:ATP-dependent Lon protease
MKARDDTTVPRVIHYTPSRDGKEEPLGFTHAYDESLPYPRRVEFLLPVSLLDQFKAEDAARVAVKEAALQQALETDCGAADGSATLASEKHPENPAEKPCEKPDYRPPVKAHQDASKVQDSAANIRNMAVPLDGAYAQRSSLPVEIVQEAEIKGLTECIQRTAKSDRPRLEEIERRFKKMGIWRHRVIPVCQEQLQMFDALLDQYPHFAEVILIYRTSAKAAAGCGQPMTPPPILMLGVPGLGKTHFAQALAACMGLPLVKLAYDSGLTNSELVGSDQHWSNTHHGKLFEHLCLHQVANPLFFLDELDKAALHYGVKGQSALNALHSCLEPTSSPAVRDISVNVTMNASHVIWLAAANDAELIPQSIRSRFTEITIRPPIKPEQMYQLNWHICKAIVEPLDVQMPNSVIRTSLAVLSPREQRKHLQSACQTALANDRDQLQEGDFAPGVIEPMQEGGGSRNGKRNAKRDGRQRGARSDCGGGMLH